MAIVKITDYVTEGIGRLPQQYRTAPRMAALLTAFLTECQAAENAMWDVFFDRELQQGVAADDLLDKLGDIVGQGRLGASNAVYRLYVSARIRTNRSIGRREELIAIAALLVPSTTIYVKDFPPGSVLIYPTETFAADPYVVACQFLGEAVAAGVLLAFVWLPQTRATSLIRDSVYGGVSTTAQQQPQSTHGGTTGGKMSGVIEVTGGP